jgi:1-deoxy-D-xylulose-5-phosphate reductoisomerase
MRVPISFAIHYPERVDVPVRPLDLLELGALRFEAVDTDTFSCLRLARGAGEIGGTAPCTLNAANEIAVRAFLAGQVRFTDIAAVIEETLARLPAGPVHSFDALADADAQARMVAGELVATRAAA